MARAEKSTLLAKKWDIPQAKVVHLVRPAKSTLERLDEEWSSQREKGDVAEGWEWSSVWGDADVFVLRDEQRTPLAAWRAVKPLVTLKGQIFYRLDNLEVKPALRGAAVGRFMLALVACRTVELSAARILLAAPPARIAWYQSIGAVDASGLGWNYPTGLAALMFEPVTVLEMKEVADALEIKK